MWNRHDFQSRQQLHFPAALISVSLHGEIEHQPAEKNPQKCWSCWLLFLYGLEEHWTGKETIAQLIIIIIKHNTVICEDIYLPQTHNLALMLKGLTVQN